MSFQCPKCGTQTRDGAKFCHGCGTPIGTATLPQNLPSGEIKNPQPPTISAELPPPATPRPTEVAFNTPPTATNAPSGYMSQMPQTYNSHAVQSSPAKKNSNTLKVILITLGIILVLGTITVIGGIYFAVQKGQEIAKNIEKDGIDLGKDVNISIGTDAEKDLGVPIYPGAQRQGFSISAKGKGEKGNVKGGFATYTTEDDIDEVVDFYKEKLGEKVQVKDTRLDESRTVELIVKGENTGTAIVVSNNGKEGAKTSIFITKGEDVSPDKIPNNPAVGGELPPLPPVPPTDTIPPPPPPAPKAQKR